MEPSGPPGGLGQDLIPGVLHIQSGDLTTPEARLVFEAIRDFRLSLEQCERYGLLVLALPEAERHRSSVIAAVHFLSSYNPAEGTDIPHPNELNRLNPFPFHEIKKSSLIRQSWKRMVGKSSVLGKVIGRIRAMHGLTPYGTGSARHPVFDRPFTVGKAPR